MSIINKIKINDTIYDIRDSSIQNKIYSNNEEPIEAKPGDIWIDLDEEGGGGKNYATEEYVDNAISAIPTPDVSGQIQAHNESSDSHGDIRDLISANEAALSLLLNGTDPETIDGVNDLINYVNEHGSEVTGIKADIKENADNIEQLNTLIGDINSLLDAINGEVV